MSRQKRKLSSSPTMLAASAPSAKLKRTNPRTDSVATGQLHPLLSRNKVIHRRKRKRYVSSFHDEWDNQSGDLDSCEVKPSNIEGAGLGLFATKHIKAGKRVTKYSGKKIGRETALSSKSSYIVEIRSQLYLDADGPGHMAGRYMNDGPEAGIPANARLGASRRVYHCKKTGRFWIPVIALRNIRPGEEIIIKYGNQVTWKWPSNAGAPSPPHPDGNDDSDKNQNQKNDERSTHDSGDTSSGLGPNTTTSQPPPDTSRNSLTTDPVSDISGQDPTYQNKPIFSVHLEGKAS